MLNAIKTIPNQCNTLVFFPSEGSSLLYVFTEKMKCFLYTGWIHTAKQNKKPNPDFKLCDPHVMFSFL